MPTIVYSKSGDYFVIFLSSGRPFSTRAKNIIEEYQKIQRKNDTDRYLRAG